MLFLVATPLAEALWIPVTLKVAAIIRDKILVFMIVFFKMMFLKFSMIVCYAWDKANAMPKAKRLTASEVGKC
jgi:hypothetical protein